MARERGAAATKRQPAYSLPKSRRSARAMAWERQQAATSLFFAKIRVFKAMAWERRQAATSLFFAKIPAFQHNYFQNKALFGEKSTENRSKVYQKSIISEGFHKISSEFLVDFIKFLVNFCWKPQNFR